MPWLLLDTALPRAVVAVVDGPDGQGAVLAERLLEDTRRHAETLAGAVDDVLATAGVLARTLDGIGVGAGPGSFIGVRTGLSFALGLGRAIGRPVVGLDGMVALVGSAVDPAWHGSALAVVDARRGERFVSVVVGDRQGLRAGGSPRAVAPEDVAATGVLAGVLTIVGAVDVFAAGDVHVAPAAGWPSGVDVLPLAGPTAVGLRRALAAADHTAPPHPVYVRGADAKVPATDPAARRASILLDLDAFDLARGKGGPP